MHSASARESFGGVRLGRLSMMTTASARIAWLDHSTSGRGVRSWGGSPDREGSDGDCGDEEHDVPVDRGELLV